jgi:hypothetical protein
MNPLVLRGCCLVGAVWLCASCLRLVDFESNEFQSTGSGGGSGGDSGSGGDDACAFGGCQTGCTSDYECESGIEQCVSGACQPRSCGYDAECYPGICVWETGVSGQCRPESYCSDARPCGGAATCVASSCQPRPCGSDADCFPYACLGSSCTYGCEYLTDCHPDGMCLQGQCIDPACTPETEAKCLGYACDPTTSRCRNNCDYSSGCAAGYVCDYAQCWPRCMTLEDAVCGGYVCDVASGICGTTCSISSDCASGYSCRNNHCVLQQCSDDSACNGYRCVSGECTTTCVSAADCAVGYACQAGACTL